MININELHLTLLDILNKNNSQYVSPAEMDRFINLASKDYFNELVGSKNQNRVAYGKNRVHDRRLNPFRETKSLTIVLSYTDKPADLEQVLSLAYSFGGSQRPFRQLDEQRVDKSFDNPLASPTAEDPVIAETKSGFEVYPSTIDILILKYLRTPATAKWGFTKPNNRNPVYDPETSVDLEWDESEKPQLVMRVANYLGLNIRDSSVVQFTEKEKAQS